MTKQSPRIYIYKITFEEVLYYYYGVHKEKKFDEYYMGSPVTNKWVWDFYTPEKQILEFFEYNDDGWKEANQIEKRLIKPVLNDPLCLNEGCGGCVSLKVLSENGKKVGSVWGRRNVETGHIQKLGKISGTQHWKNGTGVFARSKEQMSEHGKKGTQIQKERGEGVWGLTPEQRTSMGKKGGKKGGAIMGKRHKENGTGIFSLSKEEKLKVCSMGGKAANSQKWMCLETGFISTSGPLTLYQNKRGIDKSKRIRIQ